MIRKIVRGSGTGESGTATMSSPAEVPNENVGLRIAVEGVRPGMLKTNVTDWSKKGLCGPFPAMEPLALLYVPPLPGGPMMVCAGPACPGPDSTSSV